MTSPNNSKLEATDYLLKIELAKLLEEKKELLDENGLAFYEPHPKQELFHAAAKFKRRMVGAGNRFGKSQMGMAEDLAWALGFRPWYKEEDPRRTIGIPSYPVKGLIITENWDKVDEIFTGVEGERQGKVWQLLPKEKLVSRRKNKNSVYDRIEIKHISGGTSLLRFATVQSYKNSPLSLESSDWDFIHVDEPCPEDMYKGAARGLVDRGGSSWFTLTPLNELWINDMFFPHKTLKRKKNPLIWAIRGSMKDNPHLPIDAIAAFEAELTEEERQCRIQGFPLALSGLVYKEFNYETHVLQKLPTGWTDYQTPPRDHIISYSIDSHPQTPHAVIFFAVSPQNQVIIFDEIFTQTTPEALAELIFSRIHGYRTHYKKCEPAAWNNDSITQSCFAD